MISRHGRYKGGMGGSGLVTGNVYRYAQGVASIETAINTAVPTATWTAV